MPTTKSGSRSGHLKYRLPYLASPCMSHVPIITREPYRQNGCLSQVARFERTVRMPVILPFGRHF
jgi:hypothetical protein